MNTAFSDVSERQQQYYVQKAKEVITEMLSVIAPGQEHALWESPKEKLVFEHVLSINDNKRFDSVVRNFIATHDPMDQAASWQTKRQLLSLFANEFLKK